MLHLLELPLLITIVISSTNGLANACPGYVDPGVGSYLVQLLVAALVGLGLAVRSQRARLAELLRRFYPGKQPRDPEQQ